MIISVLSTIISSMNSGDNSYHFTYGKKGYYNLLGDDKDFPGVIYDTDSPFNLLPKQSGYIGEVYKPKLYFLFLSDLDWKPEEQDVKCITPAIVAAREFITRCQNANDLIDDIKVLGDAKQHINLLDENASGIEVDFEIKLKIDASICVT